jgi:hypothetical protein
MQQYDMGGISAVRHTGKVAVLRSEAAHRERAGNAVRRNFL